MTAMLALAGRIRHGLLNSAHTADMLLGVLALAAGAWMLVPGWAFIRYKHIAEQMSVVWPVWMWGVLFVADGGTAVLGVIGHRPGTVVVSHLVGVGLWIFLAGIMTFRAVPALEGFFCAVVGAFCLLRLAQIPSD